MQKKEIINVTKTSFIELNHFENEKLIEKCVEEAKDSLLVNPPIYIYGKQAFQHRSIGFFSNTSIGYKYSGQLAKSIKLTPSLEQLLDIVNGLYESSFNGILINKYMNGDDYIGAHSDDENNLDKIGVVCISHGATRTFRIRDKATKKIIVDIPTLNNSIMHMSENFQKDCLHEIPKEAKIKDIRYSFTFRKHLI